jgi:hypothetical protein
MVLRRGMTRASFHPTTTLTMDSSLTVDMPFVLVTKRNENDIAALSFGNYFDNGSNARHKAANSRNPTFRSRYRHSPVGRGTTHVVLEHSVQLSRPVRKERVGRKRGPCFGLRIESLFQCPPLAEVWSTYPTTGGDGSQFIFGDIPTGFMSSEIIVGTLARSSVTSFRLSTGARGFARDSSRMFLGPNFGKQ